MSTIGKEFVDGTQVRWELEFQGHVHNHPNRRTIIFSRMGGEELFVGVGPKSKDGEEQHVFIVPSIDMLTFLERVCDMIRADLKDTPDDGYYSDEFVYHKERKAKP